MGRVKGVWRRARVPGAAVEWRTAFVRVRFTPVEKSRLEEVAREMGLSVSGYLRELVLGRRLPACHAIRPIPEVNQDVYVELGRIAGSLRQLADRMDGAEPADRQEILPVLDLLAGAVADLRLKVIGVTDNDRARSGARERHDHTHAIAGHAASRLGRD